ncbi:hypothetical protein PV458_38130 [Streptomyces sp. MN03-5084-2B]|nr:hypothetical protein [Streptomyces sp. MN03-5084-2B]
MTTRITVAYAVPHELPDGSGVAHVVEHLVGHGPTGGPRYAMPALLDGAGLDTFTGLTFRGFTCYVATGDEPATAALDELFQGALRSPVSDPASIAAERGSWAGGEWRPGSVADELRLRESPYRVAVSAATAAVYAGEPLAHDPAGTAEALRHLDPERITGFQRDWLIPDRVSGVRLDRAGSVERFGACATWSWHPRTRVSATRAGTGWALAWRVGCARGLAVAAARTVAAALRTPAVRAALLNAGLRVEFGPLVDATVPDPVLVLVVGCAVEGVEGAEIARRVGDAVLSTGFGGLDTAAAGRAAATPAPLVEDEWGSVAVDLLVATMAGTDDPASDIAAVLDAARTVLSAEVTVPAPEAGFRVLGAPSGMPQGAAVGDVVVRRSPEAGFRVLRASSGLPQGAAVGDAVVRRSPEVGFRVLEAPSGVPERAAAGDVVVVEHGGAWPRGRAGASVRYYPFCPESLSGLTGMRRWGRVPAAVGVEGVGLRGIPYLELTVVASDAGGVRAALEALPDAPGTAVAADTLPALPTLAAALAGVAPASAQVGLAGFRFGTAPADRSVWTGPGGFGVIVLSGVREGRAAVRDAACEAVATLRAWVDAREPEPGAPRAVPVVDQGGGVWSLDAEGLPRSTAVVDLTAVPFAEVVGQVRAFVRDRGVYAVDGRLHPRWGAGLLTVLGCADGFLRQALAGVGGRGGAGYGLAPRPVTLPEALVAGQHEALDRRFGTDSSERARLARPVTHLHQGKAVIT